jgi:hypothetical protein
VPPPGFALCDGSIVTDAASPFNGMATPNLISRFILGTSSVSTPPASDGSVDFNLSPGETPNFTVVSMPTTARADLGVGLGKVDDAVTNTVIVQNTISSQWRYVMTEDNSVWNDGNHSHYVAIPAPGWVGLLFIIRIK